MFSADVWSVMCVAVEMVTGNLPWTCTNKVSYGVLLLKVLSLSNVSNYIVI